MNFFLERAIYPVLRFMKVPQLLNWLLSYHRTQQCLNNVTPLLGAKFGAQAVVHNRSGDRSRIKIGKHTLVDGELLVHDYGGQIEIGDYTYIGLGARVWSGESVKIGRHVFLAHNVNITDTNSHQVSAVERAEHYIRTIVRGQPFEKGSIKTAPVVIGDHAWLNFGVGVLRGVTIGEGAIIGAGSLVTHDIPPYMLAVGSPAKVVKEVPRDPDLRERVIRAERE
jgi:acetyltransferase-like isoleucine patch superfamily enzyme